MNFVILIDLQKIFYDKKQMKHFYTIFAKLANFTFFFKNGIILGSSMSVTLIK